MEFRVLLLFLALYLSSGNALKCQDYSLDSPAAADCTGSDNYCTIHVTTDAEDAETITGGCAEATDTNMAKFCYKVTKGEDEHTYCGCIGEGDEVCNTKDDCTCTTEFGYTGGDDSPLKCHQTVKVGDEVLGDVEAKCVPGMSGCEIKKETDTVTKGCTAAMYKISEDVDVCVDTSDTIDTCTCTGDLCNDADTCECDLDDEKTVKCHVGDEEIECTGYGHCQVTNMTKVTDGKITTTMEKSCIMPALYAELTQAEEMTMDKDFCYNATTFAGITETTVMACVCKGELCNTANACDCDADDDGGAVSMSVGTSLLFAASVLTSLVK